MLLLLTAGLHLLLCAAGARGRIHGVLLSRGGLLSRIVGVLIFVVGVLIFVFGRVKKFFRVGIVQLC